MQNMQSIHKLNINGENAVEGKTGVWGRALHLFSVFNLHQRKNLLKFKIDKRPVVTVKVREPFPLTPTIVLF